MKTPSEELEELKSLEMKGAKFHHDQVAKLFVYLTAGLPRLKITPVTTKRRQKLRNREKLRSKVSGLPLPDIDLFEGQFATNKRLATEVTILAISV